MPSTSRTWGRRWLTLLLGRHVWKDLLSGLGKGNPVWTEIPLLAGTGEWQRRPARRKAMCVIEKVYQKANRRLGWSCLLAFIACSTGKFAAQTQTVPPALAELKLQLERGEFETASRNAGRILA